MLVHVCGITVVTNRSFRSNVSDFLCIVQYLITIKMQEVTTSTAE